MKRYEIRCPVHGFIPISGWERDIIHHPVFQRLRRIRQLGLTDMLYPGAMHTRFEHSLGVMHTASKMFDALWHHSSETLASHNFTEDGKGRDRIMIRLAALLHDVGHSPFSHAGEGLMPIDPGTKEPYKHEAYSAALIRYQLKSVIDDHPEAGNYGIQAEHIASLIEGNPAIGARSLFLRQLVSSQLDADRADYLLRDSYHLGVAYGKYDLERLIVSLRACTTAEGSLVLAVDDGGLHVAEALILARYMMFTQVYFHRTRRAYDHHIEHAVAEMLKKHRGEPTYPAPLEKFLDDYLIWSDWKVLGLLSGNEGGEHGEILRMRNHYRWVYQTPEIVQVSEMPLVDEIHSRLGKLCAFRDLAKSSWYKLDAAKEILLSTHDDGTEKVVALSERSPVVRGLNPSNQVRLYSSAEKATEARKIVAEWTAERAKKARDDK